MLSSSRLLFSFALIFMLGFACLSPAQTTWLASPTPVGYANIAALAFNSQGECLAAGYSTDGQYLMSAFLSTDQGQTWSNFSAGLPTATLSPFYKIYGLAVDNAGYWYMTTNLNGIYRRARTDSTWTKLTDNSTPKGPLGICATPSGTVYVASAEVSGACVYRSTNHGQTWTSSTAFARGAMFAMVTMTVDAAGRIYVGGYSTSQTGVVYVSSDQGATWRKILDTQVSDSYINDVVVTPSGTLLVSATPAACGLYRSTDQGATWTRPYTGTTGGLIVAPDQRIFLGYDNSFSSGSVVFASENDGVTWSSYQTGLPDTLGLPTTFAVSPFGTFFLGSKTGIYRFSQPVPVTLSSFRCE